MQNELLYTVKKRNVAVQKEIMLDYLKTANRSNPDSTYKALNDQLKALHIATGFYKVLDNLGLLSERDMVGEDIQRIEEKINSILEEKRRKDLPKWKH